VKPPLVDRCRRIDQPTKQEGKLIADVQQGISKSGAFSVPAGVPVAKVTTTKFPALA
jgi:hypothetical protein